jgi:transcriptional regulator with GAF, ATPase, and Fis domain
MHALDTLITTVANSASTVLIRGESGTGKELVARALHSHSPRSNRPLIPVNCGAIPEDLLESELFGHVRGSFTGAMNDRVGRFVMADGGTIFLDEIGDMSPKLQVKVLRVLQEQEVEPVGSAETIKVNVRILAATNVDLERAVEEKRFREDLYYRLNVIPITVPPLRERTDDIPLLIDHFIKCFNQKQPRRIEGFSSEAVEILKNYPWPGNVRELENLVERMTILAEGSVVVPDDLPEKFHAGLRGDRAFQPAVPHVEKGINVAERIAMFSKDVAAPSHGFSAMMADLETLRQVPFTDNDGNGPQRQNLNDLIDRFEREMILKALQHSNGVKNRAAHLLGIKRTTLVEKMKKKNISFQRV